MSSPFVAEIRMWACNFAPQGWAMCDGQLMPISQNTALFSLLGTNYGGDGKSTFALPNFQGSVPIHQGQSPGGSQFFVGEQSGAENVTLITSEIPAHAHFLQGDTSSATTATPSGHVYMKAQASNQGVTTLVAIYTTATTLNASLNPVAVNVAGGSLPHNNMMPYLALNFCIALQGVFPPRG